MTHTVKPVGSSHLYIHVGERKRKQGLSRVRFYILNKLERSDCLSWGLKSCVWKRQGMGIRFIQVRASQVHTYSWRLGTCSWKRNPLHYKCQFLPSGVYNLLGRKHVRIIFACVKWSHPKGRGCTTGFAESLNEVWAWPMGCSSLLPVCTPNFTQGLGLLRNFETDVLVRFETPLPPALSLLKIPSYQTATSSQIIGFSCCSSAVFSSDRICSDHFLAIFLIVNKAHSATVYITTIQIIPPNDQLSLEKHNHVSLPISANCIWVCHRAKHGPAIVLVQMSGSHKSLNWKTPNLWARALAYFFLL